MATPPRSRGIQREALPEAPSWFEPFLQFFNEFASQVSSALERQLTVSENLSAYYHEATVRVPEGATAPFEGPGWPLNIKTQLTTRPNLVAVAQASDADTFAPVECGTPAWRMANNGGIEISSVSGLAAGRSYKLRFLVMA